MSRVPKFSTYSGNETRRELLRKIEQDLAKVVVSVESQIPPTLVDQDVTHRFATDSEKTTWNDKVSDTDLTTALAGKSDVGHTHDDRYYTESESDTALAAKADKTQAGLSSLIASKAAVDCSSAASTTLDFAAGLSLATHFVTHFVVKFATGDLTAVVVKLKNGSADLTSLLTLTVIATGGNTLIRISDGVLHTITGNLSVEVTTPSGGEGTVDVYAYGMRY